MVNSLQVSSGGGCSRGYFFAETATNSHQNSDTFPRNETPRQFDSVSSLRNSYVLARQLGFLGALLGAWWRVSRGASLGDSTSAGAENSQRTLHAATRPTMTAYRYHASREWALNPDFALLPLNQAFLESRK